MARQYWVEWQCDRDGCDQNITFPHNEAPPGWEKVSITEPDTVRTASGWLFCPMHALDIRYYVVEGHPRAPRSRT